MISAVAAIGMPIATVPMLFNRVPVISPAITPAALRIAAPVWTNFVVKDLLKSWSQEAVTFVNTTPESASRAQYRSCGSPNGQIGSSR